MTEDKSRFRMLLMTILLIVASVAVAILGIVSDEPLTLAPVFALIVGSIYMTHKLLTPPRRNDYGTSRPKTASRSV